MKRTHVTRRNKSSNTVILDLNQLRATAWCFESGCLSINPVSGKANLLFKKLNRGDRTFLGVKVV